MGLGVFGCHSSADDTPVEPASLVDASVHAESDLGARVPGTSDGDAGADLAIPRPPEIIHSGLTESVTSSAIAVSASGLA